VFVTQQVERLVGMLKEDCFGCDRQGHVGPGVWRLVKYPVVLVTKLVNVEIMVVLPLMVVVTAVVSVTISVVVSVIVVEVMED
jgi:hypothetical protein